MRALFTWLRDLFRPRVRPHEVPPPLTELSMPPSHQRNQQLSEVQSNIYERERLLRELEAKARIRGGFPR